MGKRKARAANAADRAAIRAAHMESDLRAAGISKDEVETFTSPVFVVFHHLRHRLTDRDGISGKAVLDALVQAGILADDSPAQVADVRHIQSKIGSQEEEKTIVTITTDKKLFWELTDR